MRNPSHPITNPQDSSPGDEERSLLNAILESIHGIRYGSVEIIIQDSRVVQIDRKEKIRFDRTEFRAI